MRSGAAGPEPETLQDATGADVVIAGYGPAGASAAIAAHDAGARVIVVDSAARGGGNARYSGGFLCDLPADRAVDHLDALCFGRTGRRVLEAYAAGLHDLDGWLRSLGGTTVPFEPPPVRLPAPFPSWPGLPGGQAIRYSTVAGSMGAGSTGPDGTGPDGTGTGGTGRPGEALWELLDSSVRARGIEVRYETSAQRLEIDSEGSVTGLRITHGPDVSSPTAGPDASTLTAGPDASTLTAGPDASTLTARGGVVLACGGFEADPALADAYLPLGPSWPVGHPGNTGAGLRMAQQAGAALWHMYGFFGWFSFRCAEYSAPFAIDFFGASHLFTDADGRRFADETGYEVHDRLRALLSYLPRNPNRPHLPSWAVFDEVARQAGPLNGMLGTPNDYRWSADNSVEIDRGWIISATSPAELAGKMGVEPAILEGTLAEYNASARAGRDDRFGRSADTLIPLDASRLYAIETWPGIAGTTGGPRHDDRARVLRPDGQPIPGLYAAGGVSLVWGHLIEHGGGLTDAIVFGRTAGAQAAARAAAPPVAPAGARTAVPDAAQAGRSP